MTLAMFAAMAQTVQDTGLAEYMRSSLKALPIVNWLHVVALSTVFGTIFIVDLRLLGYPDSKRPITRTSRELLRWTWAAFALAVVTGLLLFIPDATTYVRNTAFWLKMAALVGAGVNMAVFQHLTSRTVDQWDTGTRTPKGARIAGILSIAIWTLVIFLGRWIGFTKGYDFEPPPADMDFDFTLQLVGAIFPV